MCIVFFEWREDRLLVCHNRDELFSRPTKNTEWWSTSGPNSGARSTSNNSSGNDFEILAPRDEVSGGTWFGFEKTTGRCAFLTNIRELDSTKYSCSRGEFVINYLTSDTGLSALEYLEREFGSTSTGPKNEYAGFNLVVFSGRDLAYFSNRYPKEQHQQGPIALSMGTPYGLSNSILQEPYAKTRKGLDLFKGLLCEPQAAGGTIRLMEGLEALMQRKEYCPGDPLPRTGEPGFPEALVRQRSSICVPESHGYGTRTTIRFILGHSGRSGRNDDEETRTAEALEDKQRILRCVETNWNPVTLEWEKTLDLDCTISLG